MENYKTLKVFINVFLGMAVIYLAVLSLNAIKIRDYIGVSEEQRHSIFVSGEGEVTGVPDIIKVQLGYRVEKRTVSEAQSDNTDKMNSVIKKLKDDFKIDAKDIKTVNYSISPQYNWDDGRQTLRGYQVSQNVDLKVRDLEQINGILDMAGELGLNQVGGLSFEIDNPEELEAEAREKAIKAAKEKAKALAKVAGVKLGRIISFSENSNQPSPLYRANYATMDMNEGKSGGAPTIEVGSNQITIIATVEYEIL